MVKALADEVRGLKATVAALQCSNGKPSSTTWTTVPTGGSKGKGKLGGKVNDPGPKSGHSTSDSDSSPSTSPQPSRNPAGERKQQWHSIKSLPARRPNKPPKAPASSENYKPVDGVRRVWGTMRDSSCQTVLGTLQRLTSVAQSIEVRRKFKKVGEKKVRWWFLIRGEESVFECLQTEWANVENSTSWKLEQCYQPATPPTETSEPSESTSNPDQPTPSNPTAGIPRESVSNPEQPTCSHTSASETPDPGASPISGPTNAPSPAQSPANSLSPRQESANTN